MLLCLFFLLASCGNSDKKNIRISIGQYPDRIVYIKDIDDALDLKGGVINITNEWNASTYIRMDGLDEISVNSIYTELKLTSDIDFHKEGTYSVTFTYKGVSVSFPVIVIDQNYIKDRTTSE
jgi:hypothetical protein